MRKPLLEKMDLHRIKPEAYPLVYRWYPNFKKRWEVRVRKQFESRDSE